MTLIDLANPSRFLALSARVLPWLAAATVILLAIGLYQSAFARGACRGGADAGRRDQLAHHQILGRLVEHAAPAGLGDAHGRLDARQVVPDSTAGDGGRVHAAVRHAASGGDAQRDFAPPCPLP